MAQPRKGAPDSIPRATGYLEHIGKATELEFSLSQETPLPDDLVLSTEFRKSATVEKIP